MSDNYASHLFECTWPKRSEPEEFRAHPVHPLAASNYGALRRLDESPIWQEDPGKKIWTLIHECWTGELVKPYSVVRLRNLNPYDLRPQNIFISARRDSGRFLAEKAFFTNTVEEMDKRLHQVPKGLTAKEYWQLLRIPKIYITAWEKSQKKSLKSPRNSVLV